MSDERPAVSRVADAVVFAPLGLALEGRRLLPDLADRGRRQVQFTRVVGKYAVRRGEKRVQETWQEAQTVAWSLLGVFGLGGDHAQDEAPSPAAAPDTRVNGAAPAAEPRPRADSSDLAIPGYDSLSAFQVMPRLVGLGTDELEAVRSYERDTRARQTILNKIAQLQVS